MKHWMIRGPFDLEALGQFVPCVPLGIPGYCLNTWKSNSLSIITPLHKKLCIHLQLQK